jgi:hypothetical protein
MSIVRRDVSSKYDRRESKKEEKSLGKHYSLGGLRSVVRHLMNVLDQVVVHNKDIEGDHSISSPFEGIDSEEPHFEMEMALYIYAILFATVVVSLILFRNQIQEIRDNHIVRHQHQYRDIIDLLH